MMHISPQHALAQLAATLAFADDAPGASVIRLYADANAATGTVPVDAPLASIALAQPCGTITGGTLVLHPADLSGAMVLATGIPRAAHWARSDGVLVAAGTVTDATGNGDFRVEGAATAQGETSPTLYAGGKVLLSDVVLT